MTTEQKVAELRGQGLTPKAIARSLALRPAEVTAMLRANAARLAAAGPEPQGALLGCLVTRGWSAGLGLKDAARAWAQEDPASDGTRGLVTVALAREAKYGKAVCASFLVDVFCLGVKNVLGPRTALPHEAKDFVRGIFSRYPHPPAAAPIALAQNLVLGAVEYARKLGFEPHRDFERARPILGEWVGPSLLEFGEDGKPMFVNGPDDDVGRVLATLRRTVGQGNFHFMISDGPLD